MRKIGLFGGAFNPPHIEHVEVLNCAKEKFGLDFCVVFPSFLPPHKSTANDIPFDTRMDMCKLAFGDVVYSSIEKESTETNYAVNTVKKFKKIYPDDQLFYIIGGDSMADLFKWYKPEELLSLVSLVVYPRQGRESDMNVAIEKVRALGGDITVLSYVSKNFSSGEIRYLSAINSDLSKYLCPDVEKYIKDNGLYHDKCVDLARQELSDRTYAHVLRTVEWAMVLNRKLNLPISDVFYSAILHDITKNSDTLNGVPDDAIGSPVAHQFSGAEVAKKLGMSDEVINAVRYHTTGRENMSTLEKLVFVADMTELGRSYEGVEKLRELLLSDFEKGFVKCLERSYEFLLEKGQNIYFLTKNAYEYYKNK